MSNYLNVINFVRGNKRVKGMEEALLKSLRGEIELCKKYSFPSTFLIQYDALVKEEFVTVLKSAADENTEYGLWMEIVRPLVESVGIQWRGREGMDWDWYANPGFLISYTKKQREFLCDEAMNKFKEIFGCFPKCIGSWMIDSYSMDYMSRKYNISAFCICKEQHGVDGYTLWGGYYNQGYYPSKFNMLSPAQSDACQINVPVFRMLGIDPMYDYDRDRYETPWKNIYKEYPIYSFEPSLGAGKDKNYAKWMLDTYGSEKTVNYSYIQHGQENSFSWESMEDGWKMQSELLDNFIKEGKLIPLKMSEMGEWFKRNFKRTPATSMVAETDWADNGLKSIWYNCKNYRTNIFLDKNTLIIRDIYKFKEDYKERYYDGICEGKASCYDNLPVMDGVLWSSDDLRSGIFFEEEISDIDIEKDESRQIFNIKADGKSFRIILAEDGIEILGEVSLKYVKKQDTETSVLLENNGLFCKHNGFDYHIPVKADIKTAENGFDISSLDGKIKILLND